MAAISLDPMNPENYLRGQGKVYFQKEGAAGTILDYPVGNCLAFEVTPATELLKHKSRMAPTRVTDRTDNIEDSVAVRMVMEGWTPSNLELMLLGTPDIADLANIKIPIMASGSVRGHLRFVGTNARGPKWTIDLPVVEFSPSGSLDPLQDEWANMEVTGEVIWTEANGFGEASADFSAGTTAPANTIPPTVWGIAQVGQTLHGIKGEWSGSPTGYAYEWQVDSGSGFAAIAGATAIDYTVAAPEVGFPIRLEVTATNSIGSTPAASAPTADAIA
jgi:hypothetical protein